MKTDAAVLLSLLEELKDAFPGSQETVYKSLSTFNDRQGEDFNVISVVNDCCGRLRKFIDLIPNTTSIHQSSFLNAVKGFENNFRLRNMGISWQQFLTSIQQPTHTQALHFLDYMVQSQEFWKTRNVDVDDAGELLSALEELISKLPIPEFVKGMLRNDIQKLKTVLNNYEKFGEQDYWDKFLYHT